jgi:Trk K+ transport system NAD-binding subunit
VRVRRDTVLEEGDEALVLGEQKDAERLRAVFEGPG